MQRFHVDGRLRRSVAAPWTENVGSTDLELRLPRCDLIGVLPTKTLSKLIGKPWGSISRHVLTSGFRDSLAALGWTYDGTRGCLGASFKQRVEPYETSGVLSALA